MLPDRLDWRNMTDEQLESVRDRLGAADKSLEAIRAMIPEGADEQGRFNSLVLEYLGRVTETNGALGRLVLDMAQVLNRIAPPGSA